MDRKRVIIYGAGPQGRVVMEVLFAQRGFEIVGFVDDDHSKHRACVSAAMVLGGWSFARLVATDDVPAAFIVAIGNNDVRTAIGHRLRGCGLKLVNAIHPSAVVMSGAMGTGNLICAGAVIVTGTQIENDVIVNTGATIDHDSVLRMGAQVAAGVHTAGRVTIGRGAFVGVGASIGPGVTIGDRSIVGAGSVVLSDIPPDVFAWGVPARVIGPLTGSADWHEILGGKQ